jgi:hypothetical protein
LEGAEFGRTAVGLYRELDDHLFNRVAAER